MAENTDIIRLRLELEDMMTSKLKDATSDMQAQLTSMKQKATEARSAFGGLADDWRGGFASAIKGAVFGFAGFAVIGKTIGFLKESREEYKQAVQGLSQLKNALGGSTQALEDQADALGKKFVIDNDEVITMQAQLAMYIKNEEQIRKLTPAVMDLAAAKGMNLASAAAMVARGIASDSEEMGKLGVSFGDAKTEVERVSAAVLGLNKNFGGQAEALANSKDAIDEYVLGINSIKEALGGLLNERLGKMQAIGGFLGQIFAGTSAQNAYITQLEKYKLKTGEETLATLQSTSAWWLKIEAIKEAKIAEDKITLFETSQSNDPKTMILRRGIKDRVIMQQKELDEAKANRQISEDKISKIISDANEKEADRVKELADKKISDAKDKADKEKEILDKARQEYIARETDNINSFRRLEQAKIAYAFDSMEEKYAIEQSKYMQELDLAKLNKKDVEAVELEHLERMKALRDEAKVVKYAEYDKLLADEIMIREEVEALPAYDYEKKKKLDDDEKKRKAQDRRDEVAGTIQMGGQLFSAIANSNKRSAQEKKNIARVEAGINTAVAVTKALPNPFAVAFAVAMGIAQQVAISNAKFATGTPYASGGRALVGERGQEIVDLPRGATVKNNYETRNYGGNTVVMNITDTSGNLVDTFVRQIKRGEADLMVQEMFARAGAI